MSTTQEASAEIHELHKIQLWLENNPRFRAAINNAVFSTANAMNVHPHDVALYILIRTSSI